MQQQNTKNKTQTKLAGEPHQQFISSNKFFQSQIFAGQPEPIEILKKVNSDPMAKTRAAARTLLILVPISIASSGKTTMFNLISSKKKSYFAKIVSSDAIRTKIMKKIEKQSPELSQNQIFSRAAVQTNQIFYQNLRQFIAQFAQSSKQKGIILVDKNHEQSMIKRTVSCIKQFRDNFRNVEVKIVALIPQVKTYIKSSDSSFQYPFSYSYALTSMKRVISRDVHQTLSGSDQYRVNVVASFVNCFRNFPIQTSYLLDNYFDEICPVRFNNEAENWNQGIKKLLLNILQESEPQNFTMHKDIPLLTQLLKACSYKDVNKNDSASYALAQIDRIFDSFTKKENYQNMKIKQRKTQYESVKVPLMPKNKSMKHQSFYLQSCKNKHMQKKIL